MWVMQVDATANTPSRSAWCRHVWLSCCRAPEKVFGLLDCHENLDAMLPALHDILSGMCTCSPEHAAWDIRYL